MTSAACSKLNLNIASAHVATFGERARDVFYVTDLLGAQIGAPTRQAAIRSALLHLLAFAPGQSPRLSFSALLDRHPALPCSAQLPVYIACCFALDLLLPFSTRLRLRGC